jgi:FMN-dependent NADH-azoreductase
MAKLLYIQASPRGERSKSNQAAKVFIEAYSQKNPNDEIDILNVFKADLPAFDGLAVQAKYTILHGQEHTEEELQAWKAVETVIENFKSADKYVLSLPMWNFGIPYTLKQYIDIIVQPRYTFGFDEEKGYSGLVTGKPLVAIYARGGEFDNPQGLQMDYQKQYIDQVFGFMGFTNINSIIVEPTLAQGPDIAKQKLDEAIEKAKALAGQI